MITCLLSRPAIIAGDHAGVTTGKGEDLPLPGGEPLPRTDPGGNLDADIAILGLYPAAKVAQRTIAGHKMNLPVQVERTSFEHGVSESGKHLDENYLEPLGLTREDVLLLDLLPYFLANKRGKKGHTMADNIRTFESLTGEALGIEARLSPSKMVGLAREMPGNVERLTDYLSKCRPRLLLTLGVEVAAFIREQAYSRVSRDVKQYLYRGPVKLDVVGVEVDVVHLAHPGILMSGRGADWRILHDRWCEGPGRKIVGQMVPTQRLRS